MSGWVLTLLLCLLVCGVRATSDDDDDSTESEIDPCESYPCYNDGDCNTIEEQSGEYTFMCECPSGYTGVYCERGTRESPIPKSYDAAPFAREYDTTAFATTQVLPRYTPDVIQHATPDPRCQAGETMENNRCIPCKLGTFKVEIGNGACTECPNGQTTLQRGAKTRSECLVSPIVTFSPAFGPTAGHTKVTLKVVNINNFTVDTIKVAGVPCSSVNDEPIDGMVECYTGSTHTPKFGPVELEVKNRDAGKMQTFRSGASYQYRHNPSITGIDNVHTIVSGGIGINVHGTHLDSVDKPIMQVTRLPDGKNYKTGCKIQNGTIMICYTPDLRPPEFARKRFRRQSRSQNEDSPSGIRYTNRCSAFNIPFLSNYEFHIGFILDGITYLDLNDSLNIPGILNVCPDPTCNYFEKAGVKEFWPRQQQRIDVKGKRFDLGARKSDVKVAIGRNHTCEIIFFVGNEIGCKPPRAISGVSAKNTQETEINVTVHIGKNFFCKVGRLQFHYGEKSTLSSTVIVVIVLVLCAMAVVALAVMAYTYRRRRLQQYKKRALRRSMPPSTRTLNQLANTPSTLSARASVTSGTSSTMLLSADHLIDARGLPLGRQESVPFNLIEYLDEDLRLHVEESSIDHDRLTMDTCVGQGHFGLVYKGFLLDENMQKPSMVAVKTMIGSQFTVQEAKCFLDEAVIMKDFRHPNVLSLLGVVIKENKPYVILPFMEFGDLKKYIGDGSRRITVRQLLALGVQVADGMCYLAEQKFVHRDLATRNCMINKSLIVKIADFGLSRDIYKSDYYRLEDKNRPLPVKWMAIESLRSGMFSTKSDVWSFGVLLWELLTRGCTPYSDVDGFLMKAYLTSGRRLSQPEYAPDDVFAVMSSCWKAEPKDRPTFEDLAQTLRDIVNDRATRTHPDYLRLT